LFTASDIADSWQKSAIESGAGLDRMVSDNPGLWAMAATVQTMMDMGGGFVDMLRFGQGAAEGGICGYGQDVLRGIGLAGALGGISGALQAAEGFGVTKSTVNIADDFFANTKFTDKVLKQMDQGDFHSFPKSVDGFQSAGKVTKITGGDGVTREMLKIPGSYKGKEGVFEFIKEADGTINHRFFRPNPGQ